MRRRRLATPLAGSGEVLRTTRLSSGVEDVATGGVQEASGVPRAQGVAMPGGPREMLASPVTIIGVQLPILWAGDLGQHQ